MTTKTIEKREHLQVARIKIAKKLRHAIKLIADNRHGFITKYKGYRSEEEDTIMSVDALCRELKWIAPEGCGRVRDVEINVGLNLDAVLDGMRSFLESLIEKLPEVTSIRKLEKMQGFLDACVADDDVYSVEF